MLEQLFIGLIVIWIIANVVSIGHDISRAKTKKAILMAELEYKTIIRNELERRFANDNRSETQKEEQ